MYKGADLTYDLESRLQTVEVGSDVQTNMYRADGLRAWKGWNVVEPAQEGDPVAVATYYFYDGGLPVLECNASGTVTAINVFAPDGLVSRKQSGNWRHYQFDPQGSVTHRLTDTESVTNSSMYDAYGKHVSLIFPVYDAFGYNGRWGYYTDDETGLVLCTYRFCDPGTGRWMTRDPIGYWGGVNLYGYCDNAPIGLADPEGLKLRLVGFTPSEEAKVRKQIRMIESCSTNGRQLIHDLVHDDKDHIISPPNRPGDPHYNPRTDRVRYDPDETLILPNQGPGGRPLPTPPDVILIHELGHMYGRPDPGGGRPGAHVAPGDTVFDFENPHRKTRKRGKRVVY